MKDEDGGAKEEDGGVTVKKEVVTKGSSSCDGIKEAQASR